MDEIYDLLLQLEARLRVRISVLTPKEVSRINNQLDNLKQILLDYRLLKSDEFSKVYGKANSIQTDKKQERINTLRKCIELRTEQTGTFARVGCYNLEQEHGAKTVEMLGELDKLVQEKFAENKAAIERQREMRKNLPTEGGLVRHSSDTVPALLADGCVSIPRVMAEKGLEQLKKMNELTKKNVVSPQELENKILCVVDEADLKPGLQQITPEGYKKLQEFGWINNPEWAEYHAKLDASRSEDRLKRSQDNSFGKLVKEYFYGKKQDDKADALAIAQISADMIDDFNKVDSLIAAKATSVAKMIQDVDCDGPLIINQKKENDENR